MFPKRDERASALRMSVIDIKRMMATRQACACRYFWMREGRRLLSWRRSVTGMERPCFHRNAGL